MLTQEERTQKIMRVTLLGSVGNLLLLIFKFVAGIVGHSGAMMADAVHSLSDFVTDVVVMVFVKISAKPKDESHDYGHGKYETLATAIIGIALMAVGIGLFWSGCRKIYGFFFMGEDLQAPGMIALWAALLSIVVKELLYRVTRHVGRQVESDAVIANAWHHRSDALSSIATAVGIGGAIALGPRWVVFDPIAAAIVSLLIIKVAWQLIVPALDELLEKSLDAATEHEILDIILSIPGISNPHNIHTRKIGNRMAIEADIRVDPDMRVAEAHELTKVIERKLRARFGQLTHIILHIEPVKSRPTN